MLVVASAMLYYNIDVAGMSGDKANRELVQVYFQFKKALPKQLAILLQSNPPQIAHTKLNKETFLENINEVMIHKRTDKDRKFYDIFNLLGEDKIRHIKSFTALSFLDLMRRGRIYIKKFGGLKLLRLNHVICSEPEHTFNKEFIGFYSVCVFLQVTY